MGKLSGGGCDGADRQIAQGPKDARNPPGLNLASVLVEVVVPNPVQAFERASGLSQGGEDVR